MITQEADVQRVIHSLEQGKGVGLFRLILSIAAVIVLATAYLVLQFRGLSTSTGIDQAQIARELSRGHGFSTNDIRPIEAQLLEKTFGQVPPGNVPDLYHAPLNPVVNAGALYVVSTLFHLTISDFCREAAVHYGPGLQPWVMRSAKSALKVAAEAGLAVHMLFHHRAHRRVPLSGHLF